MSEQLAQLEKKNNGGGEIVTNYHYTGILNGKDDTFTCNSGGTFYLSYGGYISSFVRIWLNGVEKTNTYSAKSETYGYKGQFEFVVNKGDSIRRLVSSAGQSQYCELGVIIG